MENRNYTAVYRIMHWAIALCIVVIVVTIFLRLTWMNKDNVANITKNYLTSTNQSLSQEQLIVLAKQIRKPMWDWHIYSGYVLSGLFFLRLLLPFFGQFKFSNPLNKQLTLKEKFQFWVYIIFYVCMAVSLMTGLIIEFGPKDYKSAMESIHVLSIYYLVSYLVLHFGGILLAEMTSSKGIISKMVSGTN